MLDGMALFTERLMGWTIAILFIPMRLTSLEKDLSGLVSSLETSFRTSQRRIPTSGLVSSLEIQLTFLVNIFRTGSGLVVFEVPDWFRTKVGLS